MRWRGLKELRVSTDMRSIRLHGFRGVLLAQPYCRACLSGAICVRYNLLLYDEEGE